MIINIITNYYYTNYTLVFKRFNHPLIKQRSTPTKRVANVKHKEMFPRVM